MRPGERVLANHDAFVERHRVRQRLGHLFPSEEEGALREYLEEARNGAHFMRYDGDNTITGLG